MICLFLSIGAGLCAALGSVCAKLALNSDILIQMCTTGATAVFAALPAFGSWLRLQDGSLGLRSKTTCETISIYLQVMSFAGIFIFNAFMWTLFVKSLQLSKASVQATVTNSASNFFFSALIGHLVFGEALSIRWWIGSMMIVSGLILMQRASAKTVSQKQEHVAGVERKDK
ncbi:transmembrane protein 42-like isoform X2 [Anneissia japonica]|uniref:transmembrane protein 42-like isoform X2 n=1 Tax=Anneissia japonica TaxID=1529436 RepID=UPI00142586A9|nr:transmembrane protein 42-like isoform X2 [Anneissia japonica]